MRNKSLLHAAVASLALIGVTATHAQTYSNAVVTMNPAPVGYWPLGETTQPTLPMNLTARNLGSLGAQGNGYYGAWYQPSGNTWYFTNSIVQTQAVTYPFDGSMAMQCQSAPGQYVIVPRNANGVANTNLTLNAPFSIEAWVRIGRTNDALGSIVSQGGFAKISTGGPNPSNPYYGGLGSGWAGVQLGQYDDYLFISVCPTNGTLNTELDSSSTYHKQQLHQGFNPGDWVHVVGMCDGTSLTLYTNGVLANSTTLPKNTAGLRYVADPTTPFMIGCNSQDTVQKESLAYYGSIHDVAIYPTVLSPTSILNHYQTAYGTNATYGSAYTNAVLADAPILYYRLNDPVTTTNAGYNSASFPVANNYGSLGAAGVGVYQPGTTPGVAGPTYSGFGANSKAVALNGWLGQVDIGGGSLPAALNPVTNTPFTIVSWFQTAPADAPGRYQDIVGHGDNSYRLELDNNSGGNSFGIGTNTSANVTGSQVGFVNQADLATNRLACNDGLWHMVAGVYDGSSSIVMYIDGLMAKSNHLAGPLGFSGSTADLLLGGSSQYTYPSVGTASTLRTFDGQIAQVAIWTNALSPAQITQLYTAAGVPPTISQQPPASKTVNAGDPVSVSVLANGSAPLTYQWYKNGGTLSTQTTATLTLNPVKLSDAGTYYVKVSNPNGNTNSTSMALVVNGPPVLTNQSPTDIKVFTGTHPVLHASVYGPAPISYQWSKNNSPIAGATQSAYALTSADTASTGSSSYTCAITNAYGSVSTFSPITVQVLAAPTTPYPAQVLADNAAYYFRLDENDNGQGNGNAGVTAYDYAGGCNAYYTNTVLGNAGYSYATDPSETAAYFGYVAGSDSYAGKGSPYANFSAPAGSNAQFSVEAWINAPIAPSTDAGVVTVGYGYGGEQFALDCGGHVGANRVLRFYVTDASGGNHGVTANVATNALGDNQWHHVVGVCDEAGGKVSLYVDGVLQQSVAISAGAGLKALTEPLAIGARRSDGVTIPYTNQFQGLIDDVALYNTALSSTQVVNHYVATDVAPTITQAPPASILANAGATVTMSVGVIGTPTILYQWQVNYSDITGATNSTLTLNNVDGSMNGYIYTCNIHNDYGSTSTSGTILSVNAGPPTLTTDLSPLVSTNYTGKPTTYAVTVDGTSPFSYQWYQDGSAVAGANASSYTVTTLAGQHTYYVHVSNSYGATNSSTARLTGVAIPTLNPTAYNYKAKITFSGYNAGEVLSDFPVLVVLTNIPGFDYSQFASPSGGDLRFTDATGTNEIPHEIDEWNPAGNSTAWVQVPRLATTNDYIMAYWGNAGATSPEAWSTNGNVWVPQPFEGLPAYDIVYHLKEGAYPYLDSTTLHTATSGSATGPAATAGMVGTGAAFTGTTFLDAGTNDFGDVFTLSAWVNIPIGTSDIQGVWSEQKGGYGSPGYALWVNTYKNSDSVLEFASGGTSGGEAKTTGGALQFGAWHLLEAVVNRTNRTVNFYVDANNVPVSAGAVDGGFVQTNDLRLGEFLDNNFGFHGTMDEARIRQGSSSANWIWADYMTVAHNATFQSYGQAISSVVYLSGHMSGGYLVLSWPSGTLQTATSLSGPWANVTSTSPYQVPPAGPSRFFRVKVQ